MAYFPFMHCPLVANRKERWSVVIHLLTVQLIVKLQKEVDQIQTADISSKKHFYMSAYNLQHIF